MQHASKKLVCCLLAIEISDYEAKPIFDQVRLTQDFHNLLDATVCATSHHLVSVVEEDGALLAFLCDPEHCLRTAPAIRAATLMQDRYRERVCTAFLGVDVNFGDGEPILFETVIFGGPCDWQLYRYCTWEEAEQGHAAIVERCRVRDAGLKDQSLANKGGPPALPGRQ